jgi:hypothetical protein
MDVLFEHRAKINNRLVIGLPNSKMAVFIKGVFQTTDKEVVTELLAHSFYKRKKYHLKSDPSLVQDWLENDNEPDYLQKETVESFSDELIIELGKELVLSNQGYPALMKAELIGTPVSNQVQELIDKYTKPKKTTAKKTSSRSTVKKLEETKSEE